MASRDPRKATYGFQEGFQMVVPQPYQGMVKSDAFLSLFGILPVYLAIRRIGLSPRPGRSDDVPNEGLLPLVLSNRR